MNSASATTTRLRSNFNDIIKAYLVTSRSVGRNTVIVLDESQNLSVAVLEQVRLLNNLEADNHKLLQIILIGQPELNNLLRRKNYANCRNGSLVPI
ncbi:MAG: AAA family ATPase [Thiotrichaceae bacterium]